MTTNSRGYGRQHQKIRAAYIAAMHEGDPCCRCGRPMTKANPSLLHLDHTDDRTTYRGLAHARCNTIAGAKRGGQATTARRRARHYGHATPPPTPPAAWTSRNW